MEENHKATAFVLVMFYLLSKSVKPAGSFVIDNLLFPWYDVFGEIISMEVLELRYGL